MTTDPLFLWTFLIQNPPLLMIAVFVMAMIAPKN